VLVEPGGQAAVEVLELVEGDGAGADALEERHVVVGQVDRAPGEQDELLADHVVEAALAAVQGSIESSCRNPGVGTRRATRASVAFPAAWKGAARHALLLLRGGAATAAAVIRRRSSSECPHANNSPRIPDGAEGHVPRIRA
jgi:hypothetical protein